MDDIFEPPPVCGDSVRKESKHRITISSYFTPGVRNGVRDASPTLAEVLFTPGSEASTLTSATFPPPYISPKLSKAPDQIAQIKPTLNETHPPSSLGE